MPSSPPDSTDSPKPSATRSGDGASAAPPRRGGVQNGLGAGSRDPRATSRPLSWRTNAWLFVATMASAFLTYVDPRRPPARAEVIGALEFTVALMAILLAHEFGHYIAARIHKVDASLPYFIPLPILSPFGTMGAVIHMRSVIPTRRALLDIGAAGPLAGLVLAIPAYAWGVAHSKVIALDDAGDQLQLGTSLLSRLIDAAVAPHVPAGSDILMSPIGYAGWAGMFVTMINLIPVGQLDGGHVAFSLFGPRQNKIAEWVHRSMLAFFFISLGSFVVRDVRAGLGLWHLGRHVYNSLFWLVWFEVLAVLGSLASSKRGRPADEEEAPTPLSVGNRLFATFGLALLAGLFHDKSAPLLWVAWFSGLAVLLAMEVRWGALRPSTGLLDHPPTSAQPLSPARVAIAVLSLVLFVLLFMTAPFAI